MLRVLHVFGRMDRGGSETMIMNLYRNIDRSKLQFDFVVHTTEKCAFDEEIKLLGGRIFSVPRLTLKNFTFYKSAWKKILIEHPEWRIVHSHIMSCAGMHLSVAKSLGRKTISHSHSISAGSGKKAVAKRILEKNIKADYYFACSSAAGVFLFDEKIVNGNSFKILPNAIDTKKYDFNSEIRDKVRKAFGITNELLIGHIGNFSEVKNHRFLLDVFSLLKKRKKNVKLMLVGDGSLRDQIENYAKELGVLEDVIFTGVRSDVNELVQAMDIFVFPSLFEGLPVTLVEAQTSGLPCIISDTVPNEAILTKDLVTVMRLNESAEKWANCIVSRLGETRYSRVDEIKAKGYDVSETAKWLENFYLSIFPA